MKNSNLRLASKFFGTLAADSLIVNNECNRLISNFCYNQNEDRKASEDTKTRAEIISPSKEKQRTGKYQFRILGPLKLRK